ncbi:hypothetical protein ACFLZ0_00790 [Patescibacteria group bacterium]
MVIKLIPKEYNRIEGTDASSDFYFLGMNYNLVLSICIGLLILSFLVAGGLWAYEKNLVKKDGLIASQIQNLQSKRDIKLEGTLIELNLGIEKLDEVLKKRIYPVNIFKMLEDLILPEVVFSNFSADMPKAEVIIKAEATSYNKLAEQMVVFKEDSRVKSIGFSGISLDKVGKVSSDFQIILDPIILKENSEK